MGSFGSLYVGVSGLNVSQAALNVTSHNLANVDTKGFVRQQAILTDSNYIKWGESYISSMQKGFGSDFSTVKQVRDTFLDQAYRQETGRQAFYESQFSAVDEIEGLFGELEGVAFQGTLNDFWVALSELAKEPESIVARTSLIQTAVNFIERTEIISNQLNEYQINLNTQISKQVTRINEIGDEIKSLNLKIRHYESTGQEKANDLRDQRNSLMDELSKIVSITYKEDSKGVVTINVEGVPFVTGDTVYKLRTEKVSQGTEMLKPVWNAHGNVDLFNFDKAPSSNNNTDIGSLKGLMIARGYKQANYTDIPIRENFTSDTSYQQAVLEYNNKIGSSVIMTAQAQFDQLIHGIVTTINDILCPNTTTTLPDGSVARVLDEDAPVGLDPKLTAGEALFNRKNTDRYSDYMGYKVYNEEDKNNNYSLFTLGEIEVNQNLLQNISLIPLSDKDRTGEHDLVAARELLRKWQEPFATLSPNTLTVNNFSDYYTSFISEIANRGEQINTISKNQATMVASIDNQRTEITGVSSDDELTNLIKYQHAYNAAARYVNVVSEMLEHIIMNM